MDAPLQFPAKKIEPFFSVDNLELERLDTHKPTKGGNVKGAGPPA